CRRCCRLPGWIAQAAATPHDGAGRRPPGMRAAGIDTKKGESMKRFLVLAVVCAAAMSAAHAAEGDRIDSIDVEQLAGLLADAGYRATAGRDGEGDPMLSSSAAGANFNIYMYGCEGERCKSLQFI